MSSVSNEVRVTLPDGDVSAFDAVVLVGEQGSILPVSLLREMGLASVSLRRGSASAVFAKLAAGRWDVARFPDVRAMLQSYGGASAPLVLASFTVAAGGSVAVDLRQ